MLKRFITAAAAIGLVGCAAIAPRSAQELASAPPEVVNEYRHQVDQPVALTYRNLLNKARECWQQSTGIILSTTFFVEADPYDPSLGYARISVRVKDLVPTVVTIRPEGDTRSLVIGRSMKMAGGAYQPSHRDLPNLHDWATGKPVECRDRMLF